MTLILTVANARGVYQSSDYQLTDPKTGALVSDRAGSKQLVASFDNLHIVLAFTGVATWRVESRIVRTVDWLSAELKALPAESNIWAICRALVKRIEKFCGSRGELTLVLSVASVGKPFQTVTISNVVWERKRRRLNHHFHFEVRTVQKPFHLISGGGRDCVSERERQRLKALERNMDATPKEVMTALADINSITADNSNGSVSKECWATAQFADGDNRRSQTLNVGSQPGAISQVSRGMDFIELAKPHIPIGLDGEIRLVQSASLTTGPIGKPRTFLVSAQSITGRLTSPSGRHCASIEIGPILTNITLRRNERVTVPFAPIQVTNIQPNNESFVKSSLTRSALTSLFSIGGVTVPDGWEYIVRYWFEDGVQHVEIAESSRRFRKVAFLGDDDELVITVPEGLVSWDVQDGPAGVLEATAWWRRRPEGTKA